MKNFQRVCVCVRAYLWREKKSGAITRSTSRRTSAVTSPDICVWHPVDSLTKVLVRAALVVKQRKNDGRMLQKPMAYISWLASTV